MYISSLTFSQNFAIILFMGKGTLQNWGMVLGALTLATLSNSCSSIERPTQKTPEPRPEPTEQPRPTENQPHSADDYIRVLEEQQPKAQPNTTRNFKIGPIPENRAELLDYLFEINQNNAWGDLESKFLDPNAVNFGDTEAYAVWFKLAHPDSNDKYDAATIGKWRSEINAIQVSLNDKTVPEKIEPNPISPEIAKQIEEVAIIREAAFEKDFEELYKIFELLQLTMDGVWSASFMQEASPIIAQPGNKNPVIGEHFKFEKDMYYPDFVEESGLINDSKCKVTGAFLAREGAEYAKVKDDVEVMIKAPFYIIKPAQHQNPIICIPLSSGKTVEIDTLRLDSYFEHSWDKLSYEDQMEIAETLIAVKDDLMNFNEDVRNQLDPSKAVQRFIDVTDNFFSKQITSREGNTMLDFKLFKEVGVGNNLQSSQQSNMQEFANVGSYLAASFLEQQQRS